jgi:hypothetical protein
MGDSNHPANHRLFDGVCTEVCTVHSLAAHVCAGALDDDRPQE